MEIIKLINGETLEVTAINLQNSKNYTEWHRLNPDIRWLLPGDPDLIKSFYQDIYAEESLLTLPYQQLHRYFSLAEFLEDDYMLTKIKTSIINCLHQAYPEQCEVTLYDDTFNIINFTCLKRDVIIVRKLMDAILRKEILYEYLVALLFLANPMMAERFLDDPDPDRVTKLSMHPAPGNFSDFLELLTKMTARLYHFYKDKRDPDKMTKLKRIIDEIDLNQWTYIPTKYAPIARIELLNNGIFQPWPLGFTAQRYLEYLRDKALENPSLFLKQFNQTQSIFGYDYYHLGIDGQFGYTLNPAKRNILMGRMILPTPQIPLSNDNVKSYGIPKYS